MTRYALMWALLALSPTMMPNATLAKTIAVCGASQGYGYYPKAGLLALSDSKDAGQWHPDGITGGRVTLTSEGERFDLLFADASGAVISATGDGGEVIRVGQNHEAMAVVVNYPGKVVETYTFIKSDGGDEVVWSSNKYGAPIPKVAAYRAPCSFVSLEASPRRGPLPDPQDPRSKKGNLRPAR